MLPERMARVLVTSSQGNLEQVLAGLQLAGVMHLDQFADPTGTLARGKSMERADELSQLLVQTRGLMSQLGIDAAEYQSKRIAAEHFLDWPEEASSEIGPALADQVARSQDLDRARSDLDLVRKFESLSVDVHALSTLTSVVGRIGFADAAPVLPSGCESEFDAKTNALVVVGPKSESSSIDAALSEVGFQAVVWPTPARGVPAKAIARMQRFVSEKEQALGQADQTMDRIRSQWTTKLVALEARLEAECELAAAPNKSAVGSRTFILEGWVPTRQVDALGAKFQKHFGGQVALLNLGDAPETDGHDHGHGPTADQEAPVKLRNAKMAKPFEFILGLLGKPRYQEIDPTKLMFIFFPLFFGLMVGDVIVGAAIIGLGLFLRKNYLFGIGGDSVGKALMYGGIVSVIVGAFVFGEALGLHFVVEPELEHGEYVFTERSWETFIFGEEEVLAGHGFSCDGFIAKTHCEDYAHAVPDTSHAITPSAAEVDGAGHGDDHHGGPFTPHSSTHLSLGGVVPLGIYSKIHDVTALLLISCIIGFVHMNLGFILGARNIAKMHGVKLAVQEKVSWIIIQLALIGMVLAMLGAFPQMMLYVSIGVLLLGIGLLWAGVQHTLGAGFISVLEIPAYFGNILSYTRLAAIGASKAGMAVAFGVVAFDLVGGIGGWVIYVLAFVGITVLAVLASSLQSLRLQFVEFFSKFFEGGGRSYEPFGENASAIYPPKNN